MSTGYPLTAEQFDCGTDMCGVCDPQLDITSQEICVGVIGAHAEKSGQVGGDSDSHLYGHQTLVPKLNKVFVTGTQIPDMEGLNISQCTAEGDTTEEKKGFITGTGNCESFKRRMQCVDTKGNMGFLSTLGKCIYPYDRSKPDCYDAASLTMNHGHSPQELGFDSPHNNDMRAATEQLWLDFSTAPDVGADYTSDKYVDFPLRALHKVWGSGGDKNYNYGVSAQNVYILNGSETVFFQDKTGKRYSGSQKVLYMEAHGENYTGPVPGLYTCRVGKSIDAGAAEGMILKPPPARLSAESSGTFKCIAKDPKPPKPKKDKLPPEQQNAWYKWSRDSPVCPDSLRVFKSFDKEKSSDNVGAPRVGGVAITSKMYGPGVYNFLCYVPKTTDTKKKGRGYVFAIWPFHYSEFYSDAARLAYPRPTKSTGFDSDISQYRDKRKFPCYNLQDTGDAQSDCPPSYAECDGVKGCKPAQAELYPPNNTGNPPAQDMFSSPNYEYDIEIPANSPAFASQWNEKLGWDTMNVNTWMNDINNYDENTGAYYSQVQASKTDGSDFVSKEPEESTTKDYHWYTIDWHVEYEADGSINQDKTYIAVYFDDPFIPDGDNFKNTETPIQRDCKFLKDSDGNEYSFPSKPSGAPVHATRRFVSAVAARLTIGPWFGWWGYGRNDSPGYQNNTPDFEVAKIRVAHANITPQIKLRDKSKTTPTAGCPAPFGTGKYVADCIDLPQTYDQGLTEYNGGKLHCDFVPMHSAYFPPIPTIPKKDVTPSNNTPKPSPTSPKSYIPWIIFGIVFVVLVLAAVMLYKIKFSAKKPSINVSIVKGGGAPQVTVPMKRM